MRLDATTNWAIGTTAAVGTLAVGNPAVPHYGVFLATLLTFAFLLLEARRLTFYHLWQQRVLALERGLIAPAVVLGSEPEGLEGLAPRLGRTVPTMSLGKAIARRIRRIYFFLFVTQALAWLLKLASHPPATRSVHDIVERARIGPVPGEGVVAAVGAGLAFALFVGLVRGGSNRSRDGGG